LLLAMGAACESAKGGKKRGLADKERGVTDVKILLVAINYTNCESAGELTASTDAINFLKMAENAGIKDITVISDVGEEDPLFNRASGNGMPTKDNIYQAMANIASRLESDDIFFMYYAGHGTSVEDDTGDEEDGMDEAFCTLDEDHGLGEDTLWVDDEFSSDLVNLIPKKTRIVVFTDCCHSGSIVDLDAYKNSDSGVNKRGIISISGAQDSQTAKEVDAGGGVATTALVWACQQLENRYPDHNYTVGDVFKKMRKFMTDGGYNSTDSDQNLNISSTDGCPPEDFPWPITSKFGTPAIGHAESMQFI